MRRSLENSKKKWKTKNSSLASESIRQKMKLSVVFLLVLDVSPLLGQQQIEEFGHILLKLSFPSFYNSYKKSCCKLFPARCYPLLDSAGYTCDLLKGRVTKTEQDGWIEFKVSNMQLGDGGLYRCFVVGTHIYSDFYFEVSEAAIQHSQSQPPVTTISTPPNISTAPPDTTGPALAQDQVVIPRVSWSFGLPLAVIVSITVMVLITSLIWAVCFGLNAKHKPDKCKEAVCESLKQQAAETSGVVYTTVDFSAQQELYENLRPTWNCEHGTVEYSTLAVHR